MLRNTLTWCFDTSCHTWKNRRTILKRGLSVSALQMYPGFIFLEAWKGLNQKLPMPLTWRDMQMLPISLPNCNFAVASTVHRHASNACRAMYVVIPLFQHALNFLGPECPCILDKPRSFSLSFWEWIDDLHCDILQYHRYLPSSWPNHRWERPTSSHRGNAERGWCDDPLVLSLVSLVKLKTLHYGLMCMLLNASSTS